MISILFALLFGSFASADASDECPYLAENWSCQNISFHKVSSVYSDLKIEEFLRRSENKWTVRIFRLYTKEDGQVEEEIFLTGSRRKPYLNRTVRVAGQTNLESAFGCVPTKSLDRRSR